ncbi:MAG: hypothetical protein PVG32_15200 [Anaerolineales bacterium]|jgi:tRNA(Ile2) C34 agmatinyltransferase TiaS
MIYIGIDDTDNLTSRGTGHLARIIANELAQEHFLLGVTRHQLLIDPNIAYTAKNSCAAICLQASDQIDTVKLFNRVKKLVLAEGVPGSDPGVCVATSQEAQMVTGFGKRAQLEVLSVKEALHLAREAEVRLEAVGGDGSGVIGALAAVGLAVCGEDGRYILVKRSREISGFQMVKDVLEAGISMVCTLDGEEIRDGYVLVDKIRPSRRSSKAVLLVEKQRNYWLPLKLD